MIRKGTLRRNLQMFPKGRGMGKRGSPERSKRQDAASSSQTALKSVSRCREPRADFISASRIPARARSSAPTSSAGSSPSPTRTSSSIGRTSPTSSRTAPPRHSPIQKSGSTAKSSNESRSTNLPRARVSAGAAMGASSSSEARPTTRAPRRRSRRSPRSMTARSASPAPPPSRNRKTSARKISSQGRDPFIHADQTHRAARRRGSSARAARPTCTPPEKPAATKNFAAG